MPCPRCGADRGDLLPTSSGRATCRRCGASLVLAEPVEPAAAMPASIPGRRRSVVLPFLALLLVLLTIGAAWGLRGYVRALAAREQQERCAERLHQIAVALTNYADEHGVYPPAIIRDATGKPLHSWRVLILPQLGSEEEKLHQEYHYNEPWNGPLNRKLAGRMPAVYRCPEDPTACDDHTSYVAIVDGARGEFAAYPAAGTVPQKTPLTTYVVVEMSDSGIQWMEPKDISLGKNSQPEEPLPERFSYHVGGSVAVDADGTTVVLPHNGASRAMIGTANEAARRK